MFYERTKVAEMLETDDKLMQQHGMELIGDGSAEKGKAVMDIVLAKK